MSPTSYRLDDRVAIVTGAGGWLGPDICQALAAAGAAVAVVGRTDATIERTRDLVAEAGGRALSVVCDITDEDSVARMAATVCQELGGVDILVNNAAIYPVRPWTEITVAEWDAVLATNLRGSFLCARAVYESMKDRRNGRVINLTSATFHTGFPDMTVLDYVSSKGALIGFTRALAREVGLDGITVNAISAGALERPEHTTPEYNDWVLGRQCLKRRGTGGEVGDLAVFLAGDGASFITAQTIVVDGGMAMV